MAASLGITDRWAHKVLVAGEWLSSEEAAPLVAAPERVGIKDLVDLAKVGEPEERNRPAARVERVLVRTHAR